MTIQEARTFVARFVQGKYSREEHQIFQEWVNGAPIDQIEKIAEEFEAQQKLASLKGAPGAEWTRQLESRIDALEAAPVIPMNRKKKFNAVIGWAAAIVVVFGAGLYLMLNREQENGAKDLVQQNAGSAIVPGSQKAILTLADGRNIELTEKADGTLAEEGGAAIRKTNNVLVYEQKGNSKNGNLAYNTITTPNGGQYQVILPDQTKIWLNAGSSIRFPVVFSGNERKVAITGEVYFEVAQNPNKPFKAVIATELTADGVSKGRGEVEVVGTHFNIMAYPNEPAIQTTLLKGSVKVVSDKNSRVLKPGQQARIRDYPVTTDQLTVRDIPNAENAVAWTNGFFAAGSAEFLMRQIARWYDVQLEYEGKIPDIQFEGQLPRSAEIKDVLKILDANGIHTKLDNINRKIVVKQ